MKRLLMAALPLFATVVAGSIPCAAAEPAPSSGGASTAGEILPEDYIVGSWEVYRTRFVTEEGRITDDDNGMISHSEGQGYGLLIAEAAGDRASFDRIWDWTKRELFVRDDGLAAWKWDPAATPHIADINDATDGDLLIAWALLRAGQRWDVDAYRTKARDIAEAVAELGVTDSAYGRVLLPAVSGFGAGAQPDGPVVNLSYWVLPAIAELEAISPKLKAADLAASGRKLLKASTFGTLQLPTDWVALGSGKAQPAKNFTAEYGYNAVRIPLYLAWAPRMDEAAMTRFADAWVVDGQIAPRTIAVETDLTLNSMPDPGYMAMTDLMACSLQRAEMAPAAKAFVPTSYYPSTLHILTLMALSERYPQCF